MTKHIHAELMLEYAKDAMETDKPWERWEYFAFYAVEWEDCLTTPTWGENNKYRRKTKPININGYEVPEPCREKPEVNIRYYVPNILQDVLFDDFFWDDDGHDNAYFNAGLVHLTGSAAITHAKALLSFTKGLNDEY